MRRREFISFAGGAVSWPLATRAQPRAMPVVGCLRAGSAKDGSAGNTALSDGLHELGYVEAKDLVLEYRWADGQYGRLPGLAADLVHRRVDVIVATATLCAHAAKAATATIPVVFITGTDPVKEGLVASLNRPEANLTGVTFYASVLVTKHLELTHDLVPKAATIALLMNPTSPTADMVERDVRSAGTALGRRIRILRASSERELDAAFTALAEIRAGALVIASDPFFDGRRAHPHNPGHAAVCTENSNRHELPLWPLVFSWSVRRTRTFGRFRE